MGDKNMGEGLWVKKTSVGQKSNLWSMGEKHLAEEKYTIFGKSVAKKSVGEKSVGEEFVGEKSKGAKSVGEDSMGEKSVGLKV